RPVQDVCIEQGYDLALVESGHIPRTIDQRSVERCRNLTRVRKHEQAAGLSGSGCAVSCRQAAYNHPPALEHSERGREADAPYTRTRQIVRVDHSKDTGGSGGRDIYDGRSGSLKILTVIEVADEDVTLGEIANGYRNNCYAIGIHVTVRWNGRSN